MLKKLGEAAEITRDHAKIANADKLILPGVGAFDDGMKNLEEQGLIPLLNKKVLVEKTPILGICLGMQLMTAKSAEGNIPGLNWIEGEVKRFPELFNGEKLRIPHMGWNVLVPQNDAENNIFRAELAQLRFYFVHSFYVQVKNAAEIIGSTSYGYEFVSAFKKDNIIGMQFHPEKSHKFGMAILKNFIES